MRKSIEADKTDIPQLTREQLGRGVRGKYYKAVLQGSNLVLLRPEVWKAFPTSEAVNDALSALLAPKAQRRDAPADQKLAADCGAGGRERARAALDDRAAADQEDVVPTMAKLESLLG